VTTYQAVAAAPALHLAEFSHHRTFLVVDEMHHLPALAETDPVAAAQPAEGEEDQASVSSRAIMPLLETSAVRLLLSGTVERADGRGILWLPYSRGPKARTGEVELDAPGWAGIGYSRAQALSEKAVIPVTFGALDGEASWRENDVESGPHRLAAAYPGETTRPALFTALRTGFAEALLREAFLAVRDLRARRREERGLPLAASARGLGKMLAVAPDQTTASTTWRWCGGGFRRLGQRRWPRLPRRTRRGRIRSSRRTGYGRSPRSWSQWRWPMRGWTRRRRPWWRL
jgi:hypothetical protein